MHARSHVPRLPPLPDGYEDVLHDILGRIARPRQPFAEPLERRMVRPKQDQKRLVVSGANAIDERSLLLTGRFYRWPACG